MSGKMIAAAVPLAFRFCAIAAVAAVVSGCSMGNMFGGGGSATYANASASQTDVAAAAPDALPAIATECPPIKVRPGMEAIFNYGGAAVDAKKLQYQAVIEKQSRNCVVSNGLITVKMGAVGRVLLGPAGKQTSVTVPLRFDVERDNVTMFSEKYDIPVAITPPGESAEFVKVVDNVAIPYLGGEQIVIWVGFDPKG
jgi:hypothetical protein